MNLIRETHYSGERRENDVNVFESISNWFHLWVPCNLFSWCPPPICWLKFRFDVAVRSCYIMLVVVCMNVEDTLIKAWTKIEDRTCLL